MLKNVIKVLLSNGAIAAIGLINSFLFPLILTTTDYATYQEYMLYISYINICHLGIASGMFLNYAGNKYSSIDKKQYKSGIYLLFLTLAGFTGIGIIVFAISQNILFLYTVITIIPQCLIASFQALYQAWERFTEYSIINVLPKLLLSISMGVSFFTGIANGNTAILSYIVIVWGITLYFIYEFIRDTRGIKTNKIFSKKNGKTTWNGLLITVGNYINILFHSIDKQFVLLIYSKESFALYSFAMSLQNIMMIFITALANPFYVRFAKGGIDRDKIGRMKELLFIFGAYSGCAFFAVSFVVDKFISKYSGALIVCAMFFAVFPAMAVINVLYINLYKVQQKLKKYIVTLVGMLAVATVANTIAVIFHGDYIGISLATMVCYYIWLFYSQHHFEEISIRLKDIFYLIGFMIIYFSSVTLIKNAIIGFMAYAALISLWNCLLYKKTVSHLKTYLFKRIMYD